MGLLADISGPIGSLFRRAGPVETYNAPWDESKHPRGDDGRFIEAHELAAARKDPGKAAELRKRVTDPTNRKKLDTALDDGGHQEEPMKPRLGTPKQRDNKAFLMSIIAKPDDDAPWLVYADWLEENGKEATAAKIRAAIAKGETPSLSGLVGLRVRFHSPEYGQVSGRIIAVNQPWDRPGTVRVDLEKAERHDRRMRALGTMREIPITSIMDID